jgi:sec-independent protein translocase protein TatA
MLEVPSLPHLLMVLVIVMLLFGANRIPEIAGSMGKGIKEFKKGVQEVSHEVSPELYRDDPRSISASLQAGNHVEEETRREPKRLLM